MPIRLPMGREVSIDSEMSCVTSLQESIRIPSSHLLSNQLASRHRRSNIRARWRITQRLVSDTFKTLQISPVSAPSISRRVKAFAWFGQESPERHLVR